MDRSTAHGREAAENAWIRLSCSASLPQRSNAAARGSHPEEDGFLPRGRLGQTPPRHRRRHEDQRCRLRPSIPLDVGRTIGTLRDLGRVVAPNRRIVRWERDRRSSTMQRRNCSTTAHTAIAAGTGLSPRASWLALAWRCSYCDTTCAWDPVRPYGLL